MLETLTKRKLEEFCAAQVNGRYKNVCRIQKPVQHEAWQKPLELFLLYQNIF